MGFFQDFVDSRGVKPPTPKPVPTPTPPKSVAQPKVSVPKISVVDKLKSTASKFFTNNIKAVTPQPLQSAAKMGIGNINKIVPQTAPVRKLMKGDLVGAGQGVKTDFAKFGNNMMKSSDARAEMFLLKRNNALTPEKTTQLQAKIKEGDQFAVGQVAGMVGGPSKNFSKQQLNLVRNGFTQEVRDKVGQFAAQVETNPNVNKKAVGEVGDYVQSLAETIFGKNKVANLSNKQLLNILDAVQEEAFKLKPNNKLSIGLNTGDIRNGATKIATQVSGKVDDVKLLGPGDRDARLRDILKTAKDRLPEQEAIYKAGRSEKFAKLDDAYQSAGGGEAGLAAKMNVLKGSFDKVDLAPIRQQLSESDVKVLIDRIEQTPYLTTIEKVPAQKAFSALLDGKLPTESELKKLKMVFPPDVVAEMTARVSKTDKFINVGTLPRTLKSTLDLSAPLRQGLYFATSHPKDFARSFKKMFGYAFSEKKFANAMQDLPKRQNYLKMREAGIDFTDMDGIGQSEEAFMSNLVNKVPALGSVVRGSARSYTGFLNNLRADVFDTIYNNGVKAGLANDEKFLKDLGGLVNAGTGRGDWSKVLGSQFGSKANAASPLLNTVFFSPRLMASRLTLMNPNYYRTLHPALRKEAAKSSVAMVANGMTILGLFKLMGADVETDPRSSDFGKIKYGNTRYDPWGGFQQYATYIARMISNETKSTSTGEVRNLDEGYGAKGRAGVSERFVRSKLAPVPAGVWDLAEKKNLIGEPVSLLGQGESKSAVKNAVEPFILNDLGDTVKEYGYFGPIVSMPGLFGVGSQTYNDSSSSTPPKAIGTRVF